MTSSTGVLADFVSAARSFAAGRVAEALRVLMPVELTEDDELHQRVRHLMAVGAKLLGSIVPTGGMRPQSTRWYVEPAQLLAAQFIDAGARGDDEAIQDLLAAHRAEVLVDVLVELVVRFARQEFLRQLSARVTHRSVMAGVLALAGEAPGLTDGQLRARLAGLHETARRLERQS